MWGFQCFLSILWTMASNRSTFLTNPIFLNEQQKPQTFFCVFCENTTCLYMNNFNLFVSHMKIEHKIFFEYEILLAISFIDQEDKEIIIKRVVTNISSDKYPETNLPQEISQSESPSSEELVTKRVTLGSLELNELLLQGERTSPDKEMLEILMSSRSLKDENLTRGVLSTSEENSCLQSVIQESSILVKEVKTSTALKYVAVKTETFDLACKCHCLKCQRCQQKVDNQKFECDKCGRQFKNKHGLSVHSKHTGLCTENRQCKKCEKMFKNWYNLREHMEMVRNCDKKDRGCEKCGKQFSFPSQLAAHLKGLQSGKKCVVKKIKVFDCFRCHVVFSTKAKLLLHKSNTYRCDKSCSICGKYFKQKVHLTAHVKRRCGKPKTEKIKCDICLTNFFNNTCFSLHNERKRKCIKRTECEKCGVKLADFHYRTHIMQECSTFDCPDCGEKFAFNKRFKQHIKKHKRKEIIENGTGLKGDFLCQPCDVIFNGKLMYDQHQFQCTNKVLGKNYVGSPKTEEMLVCLKCEKKFKLAKNFSIHQTNGLCRFPQDTIKYSCDLCEYEGSQKYILVLHKNVKHHGVKFNCDKCEFESTYMTSIKRHMQKVHKTIIEVSSGSTYLRS